MNAIAICLAYFVAGDVWDRIQHWRRYRNPPQLLLGPLPPFEKSENEKFIEEIMEFTRENMRKAREQDDTDKPWNA